MKSFEYHQPKNLSKFFSYCAASDYTILAGGTDVLPKIHKGMLTPTKIIDISAIQELYLITETENCLSIGALTTFRQLENTPMIKAHFPALHEAVRSIGSPTTRSRGSLGGNIANASPAGDTLSALIVHAATIELQSKQGTRILSLEDFLIGPGKTAILPGEIIFCIHVPKLSGMQSSSFQKHGPRSGMTISIVNAATFLAITPNTMIQDVRIALGAVSPTVVRCKGAEAFLMGKAPGINIWEETAEIAIQEIHPIEDVRGTISYRLALAKGLLIRALEHAFTTAKRKQTNG